MLDVAEEGEEPELLLDAGDGGAASSLPHGRDVVVRPLAEALEWLPPPRATLARAARIGPPSEALE